MANSGVTKRWASGTCGVEPTVVSSREPTMASRFLGRTTRLADTTDAV
jgi:hypothetical protein